LTSSLVRVVDHRLAGVERALVVALAHLGVEGDLQRGPVAGVELEGAAQEGRGLGGLVLLLLDLGEPEVDDRADLVGALLGADGEQVLVGGEGLGPLLALEQEVGLAEQGGPVAGLELEGAAKQLERARALAEQALDAGGPQAQLDVGLDGDRGADGLAHEHLEDRRGGDVVAGLVVDLREHGADAHVLGVELHHAGEHAGGAIDLAGLAVVDEAGLAAELDALVVAGAADDEGLEGLGEAGVVLAAAINFGEQDQRGGVAGLQLEGAVQVDLGALGDAEALVEQLGGAGEGLAARERVVREGEEVVEGRGGGLPGAGALVEAGQREHGVGDVGLEAIISR
jgi:hypothetical protein